MKRDWIARELTMEVIVGAFMLMVFLGLGYFTIILSRETWFGTKTPIEVVFADVMGLAEGDSVVVRGMPVGSVARLSLKEDGVHVRATLDAPIKVRADYRIHIVATSILGGHHMVIDQGTTGKPDLPLRGGEPYDLMGDAAELVSAVKKGIVEGGVLDDLRTAVSELKDVAVRLNSGQGTLGRLLSADDTLYDDAAAAVASLKEVASRVEQGKGTMGRLFSADDTLYRDLSDSVAALKQVSERLAAGEGTIGRLLSGEDQLYDDLAAGVSSLKQVAGRLERGEGTLGRLFASDDALYTDLAATVASLKNVVARIEAGEGMLGRLVQDDSLYDEVSSLVEEARESMDDLRETTPVTSFTSIFFGAF